MRAQWPASLQLDLKRLYCGGAVLLGNCPGAQGAAGVVADPDCGFDVVFVLPDGVVEPDCELGVVELDPLGAVLVTQGAGVVPGVLVCALPPGCTPGTGAGAVGVVPLCGVDGAGCVCGVEGELCVVWPAAWVVVVVGGPTVEEGVEVEGAPVGGGAVGVAAC